MGDVRTTNAEVETLLQDRDALIREISESLETALKRMHTTKNKHRRDVEFQRDDWVYLAQVKTLKAVLMLGPRLKPKQRKRRRPLLCFSPRT